VSYLAEAANQDGFRFEPQANSVACRSSLTITFDEPETSA
jgi:hypothetical protein